MPKVAAVSFNLPWPIRKVHPAAAAPNDVENYEDGVEEHDDDDVEDAAAKSSGDVAAGTVGQVTSRGWC